MVQASKAEGSFPSGSARGSTPARARALSSAAAAGPLAHPARTSGGSATALVKRGRKRCTED
jgi:hypothetical protein